MGKHYDREIILEVLELKKTGKTKKEIEERYGLSKKQIKNLLNCHRKNQENLSNGILPKSKGRPRIKSLTTIQELELDKIY